MFLWCVQEVAELKEEDIISHTATATQLPTAIAVAVIDVFSKTISEFYLLYSKTLHGKVKNVHGYSNYLFISVSLATQAVVIMISQSIFKEASLMWHTSAIVTSS